MGIRLLMVSGQETKLTKANKSSDSLRTTVPASVVKQFDLKEGDKLRWRFEGNKQGLQLIVEPSKQ